MEISLLGGTYQQKYREWNDQRTINWYPVIASQEEQDRTQIALFPFPGLTQFATASSGRYWRGIFTARTTSYNRCFAVLDKTLYEINANGTLTSRGTLSSLAVGTTRVWMIVNAQSQLGIFHPSASYSFDLGTNTLTAISSGQFPTNVIYADFEDGYAIVVSPNNTFSVVTSIFYSTNNDMLTGWLSTNTFVPTFKPSQVKAVVCYKQYLICFTETTIEAYQNDGTTPFSRMSGATSSIGLTSAESIASINEGIFFIGRTEKGESNVYFFTQYFNISNLTADAPPSITWALNQQQLLDDAYGYVVYSKDGHCFYYLTIPGLNNTWVYDTVTKMWSERETRRPYTDADGSYIDGRFRGRHYTNFNGMDLFTDVFGPTIFKGDYGTSLDGSASCPIIRTRISQTFSQEKLRIGINELEIEGNMGYGIYNDLVNSPTLQISYSKDGGYNYSGPRNVSLGSSGDHSHRARLLNLGTARKWTWKLVCSDNTDLMLERAIAHGQIGSS